MTHKFWRDVAIGDSIGDRVVRHAAACEWLEDDGGVVRLMGWMQLCFEGDPALYYVDPATPVEDANTLAWRHDPATRFKLPPLEDLTEQ